MRQCILDKPTLFRFIDVFLIALLEPGTNFEYLCKVTRPHLGSPFALPAPYLPPGTFTRPLPDSQGIADS